MSLHSFKTSHRRCGICGAEMSFRDADAKRVCANGHAAFPRADPAVLVCVTSPSGYTLLGRKVLARARNSHPPLPKAEWPTNRFSLVAGFVNAGEPLEDAAVREVEEETGVLIDVPFASLRPSPHSQNL
jgi:NAD+ diphosphatase